MSVNTVINIDAVRAAKDKATSEKVSKIVFIHNEINRLEDELKRLQIEFKLAFNRSSYPLMLIISRKMYDFSIKLDGYKKYEQLVLQNKI